jgi:hypothetical protein
LRFVLSDAFPPKGIFHYFTQMKLVDLLNEIEFTTSSAIFEHSFCLATFNFTPDVVLVSSKYYQFYFKNRKIKLTGYLFKAADEWFPTGWKLEISLNGINWSIIHLIQNDQRLSRSNKINSFKVSKPIQASYLRLSFLSSTDKDHSVRLKGFEIFGEIQEDQKLQSFLSIPKVISIPNLIEFKFNHNNHFGLFHFFQDCSINMRNEIFVLRCFQSVGGFLSQILIEWNNDIWISKDDIYASIVVEFKDPWIFQITGYRLRAGNQKFLQNWEIFGSKTRNRYAIFIIPLDQQIQNQKISSIYSEKSFEIKNPEWCYYLQLSQIEENSEGTSEIYLSGIEFFDTLKRKNDN